MATPNYAFVKRQKDLAKKQKKEEKLKRKAEAQNEPAQEEATEPPVAGDDQTTTP